MLWIKGLIFTLLVPCVVGGLLPSYIYHGSPMPGGFWDAGWLLVGTGSIIYLLCLFRFLLSDGTPAIFFTRHLGFLMGEEPRQVVQIGLYRSSRNPMYVGEIVAVFGQALLFASLNVALYGFALCVFFHLVVVSLEEPHLRKERGLPYEEYCKRVPRWLGLPR
jgi:protein-S-isoprenylcysteine O-methyltransferase Ste14